MISATARVWLESINFGAPPDHRRVNKYLAKISPNLDYAGRRLHIAAVQRAVKKACD